MNQEVSQAFGPCSDVTASIQKKLELLVRTHQQRTSLLLILHLGGGVTVVLPEATMKHLDGSVMHLLPAMKAASLTKRADRVRESVVQIVKEHFIPAMLAAKDEGHETHHDRPTTVGVCRQEIVPWM